MRAKPDCDQHFPLEPLLLMQPMTALLRTAPGIRPALSATATEQLTLGQPDAAVPPRRA